MLVLLLLLNPFLFGVNQPFEERARILLLATFMYTFLVPLLAIGLLMALGFLSSIQMEDKQDRTGPYLLTGMLYLWVYYNFLKQGEMPTAYVSFMLGVVIALFVAFFINIFSKISIHAVGMGGLVGMVLITLFRFGPQGVAIPIGGSVVELTTLGILFIVIFLAGLVGSCRLLLSAHQPLDLYGGYLVGFLAQVLALTFVF